MLFSLWAIRDYELAVFRAVTQGWGVRELGRMTAPDSDGQVSVECIIRLQSEAAAELRSCRNDLLEQLRVCCRYFNEGEREGLDLGALIDYLGISSPSVLDQAGYSDTEAQRFMDSLPLITVDKEGRSHAPSALPVPPPPPAPPPEQTGFNF